MMEQNSKHKSQCRAEWTAASKALILASWNDFIAKFPTDRDCNEALLQQEGAVCCKNCHGNNFARAYGDKTAICLDCKTENWFFAGTFFNHIKKPKAWLGAIWLFEHGIPFNAKDLEKLAEISYEPAFKIIKKLSMVIKESMQNQSECREVTSAAFIKTFFRRSLRTPAQAHPNAEQEAMENEMEEFEQSKKQNSGNADGEAVYDKAEDLREIVLQSLTSEPMHFNDIVEKTHVTAVQLGATLIEMELENLIQQTAGDYYFRNCSRSLSFPESAAHSGSNKGACKIDYSAKLEAIIKYILENFLGIARKYLQDYIALYWCTFDKKTWGEGQLLKACQRFRAVSSDEIRNYVTPTRAAVIYF